MTAKARQAADNSEALDAFICAKRQIGPILERSMVPSADQFGSHPSEIYWGHFGLLTHCAGLPRQIIDSAFNDSKQAG